MKYFSVTYITAQKLASFFLHRRPQDNIVQASGLLKGRVTDKTIIHHVRMTLGSITNSLTPLFATTQTVRF